MDQQQLDLAVEALLAFTNYAQMKEEITNKREQPRLILCKDYSGRVQDLGRDIYYFGFRDMKDLLIRSLMLMAFFQMDAEIPLLHYDEDGNEFFFEAEADPDEASTPHISWELFLKAIGNFKKMHGGSYKDAVRKALQLSTWSRDDGKVFYSL